MDLVGVNETFKWSAVIKFHDRSRQLTYFLLMTSMWRIPKRVCHHVCGTHSRWTTGQWSLGKPTNYLRVAALPDWSEFTSSFQFDLCPNFLRYQTTYSHCVDFTDKYSVYRDSCGVSVQLQAADLDADGLMAGLLSSIMLQTINTINELFRQLHWECLIR